MQKILIIDDEENIRDVLVYTLKKAGYAVFTCVDGQDATSFLESNTVDLIITDILMPNKDGIEIINHHRKIFRNTPIIAMSGGGRIGLGSIKKTCQLLGTKTFVSKPFEPSKMVETVRMTLA